MDLAPGTVVGGDFRILNRLAHGGMGAVYVAEQLSTGQRRALKVMHPALVAAPGARERFVQEARVGAHIPSEHVVQVIAAGVDEQLGVPWLSMELLQGEDLGSYAARQGPLPFDEVVRIFRPLCHALGAAHAAGIAHRDVKPENVFLASALSADTTQHVKVLDFGIAKLVAEAKDAPTAQVGTPLWMAPEQADVGKSISGATDVWALGLMAFRLLVGQPYWRTARDPSSSLQALLKESLMDPLVPASQRATEYGMGHALPPGFDAWFSHCVDREPARRFPSAHEAYSALQALASRTGPSAMATSSVPASLPAQPPSSPQRKTSLLPWLLLGGVVLLLGGGLLLAVGGGAIAYFGLTSSDEGLVAAPAPAASAAPAAAAPEETPAASASDDVPEGNAPPAKTTTTSPHAATTTAPETPAAASAAASTATSAAPEETKLSTFDHGKAQSKVNAAAAKAASQCASAKNADAGVESYSGFIGFRTNGGTSFTMSGAGGSRKCVYDTMRAVTYGPYDGDDTKPVMIKFAVSVK